MTRANLDFVDKFVAKLNNEPSLKSWYKKVKLLGSWTFSNHICTVLKTFSFLICELFHVNPIYKVLWHTTPLDLIQYQDIYQIRDCDSHDSRSSYRSCLRISTAQTSYLLRYLLAVLVLWMICTGVDWIWNYCFKRTLHYSKTRLAIFFATCLVYLYSGW